MNGTRRTQRSALALAAALALAFFAVACGEDAGTAEPPGTSPPASSPVPSPAVTPTVTTTASPASPTPMTPEVSWEWLSSRQYREWETAPGWGTRRTSSSPHSDAKVIFIDPAIAATIGSGAARFPPGATIVKEGYSADGDLEIVAAMQRLTGDGWLFAEYRADGSVIEEGENPGLCTRCHRGGQDGSLALTLD